MIRTAHPSDQAYVASTWVQSMMSCERGRDRKLAAHKRLLVDRVLDRPDVNVLITASQHDEALIVGWLAYTRIVGARLTDKPRYVLHFAYTREPLREKGVLRRMLEHIGITSMSGVMVTFTGPSTKRLERRFLKSAIRIEPKTFLEMT